MAYGAAVLAAQAAGAAELVDPRPFAVGSIAQTFERFPHLGRVLPAMGYGDAQVEELRETIARSDADLVLIGTPIDLRRLISFDKPACASATGSRSSAGRACARSWRHAAC